MRRGMLATMITTWLVICIMGCGMDHDAQQTSEVAGAIRDEVSISKLYEMPDEVYIEAGIFDIDVKTSTNGLFEVSYIGPQKHFPIIDYDTDSKVMKITQPSTGVVDQKPEKIDRCILTLKIPEEKLKAFEARLGVGEINIDKLASEEVAIKSGTGDICAGDLKGNTIDITSNAGNVEVFKATFENIKIIAAIGDVTLETENVISDYTVSIKTGLGNTFVEDEPVAADYKQSGNQGSITIVDELGSVNVYSRSLTGMSSFWGVCGIWRIVRYED